MLSLEANKSFDKILSEVLEYESNGYGCLMITLIGQIYQNHTYDTKNFIFYLIQLGYDHKVDMEKVLNLIGNEGCTLFSLACREKELTKFLIEKRVRMTTLDSQFQIPHLYETNVLESIVMGANPHVINATGESPFDMAYER